MASDKQGEKYYGWRLGVWRNYSAFASAAWLSYGLNGEQVAALAEYYSLISNCLANIALTLGEEALNKDDF